MSHVIQRQFFYLFAAISLLASAQSTAMSLQESIKISFERNPKTQANDLRLDAANIRTKAAWMAFLPTGNLSYNVSRSNSEFSSLGTVIPSSDQSRNFNVGMTLNIFNGGADLNNARAQEARYKAQQALMNSTNGLIPNTRGSLASNVFGTYTQLVKILEQKQFYKYESEVLTKIQSAAQTPQEKTRVQNAISNLAVNIESLNYEEQNTKRDFQFLVQMPAPEQLDSYLKIISDLTIPKNPKDAIEIALEKSPEVLVSNLNLESAQLSHKAQVGATNSPRIDLMVNRSRGNNWDQTNTLASSSGTTVGITASWSFSAPRIMQNSAAQKEVEAAVKDRDAAIIDLTHDLESVYPELENYSKLFDLFQQNYNTTQIALDTLLAQIEAGHKVDIVFALDLGNSLDNQWRQTISMSQSIASTHFRIQKLTGVLFDNMGMRNFRAQ